MKTSNRKKALFGALLALPLAVAVGLSSSTFQPIQASAVPLVSMTASFAYAPEANSPSPELTVVIEVNLPDDPDAKRYGLQLWVTGPGLGEDWSYSKAASSCNNLATPNVSQLAACDIEITRTRGGVTEPLQLNAINYPLSCCLNFGTATNYADATNNILQNDIYTIKLAAGAFNTTGIGSSYAVKSYITGFYSNNTNYGIPGQSPTFEVVAAGTREEQLRLSARRFVTVTDVNPIKVATKKQLITITGTNLETVTEVLVDGIKSKVSSQASNELKVFAPKGPIGLVDLELKSPLNNVLLAKELDYGAPRYSDRKEVLIIRGFGLDSSELTKDMRVKIKKWLKKYPELATLKCTGYTSLPRKASDVALSTKRGKQACNFAKGQLHSIETKVSKGIEDPRPGASIRRVRLVLTP